MRALSIRQPYAWAIFHAGKDVENRNWKSIYSIDTIAIHVPMRLAALEDWPEGVEIPAALRNLVRRAIIGVVDVVEISEDYQSRWFRGPLGWVIRNPRLLPRPIPCAGGRRLWEVSHEIAAEVQQQLRGRLRIRLPRA